MLQDVATSALEHSVILVETTASPLVSATKWTLKTLILMIFVLWAAFIFFLPAKPVNELFSKWNDLNRDTPFGVTGYLIIFPFVFFAFSNSIFFISYRSWGMLRTNYSA